MLILYREHMFFCICRERLGMNDYLYQEFMKRMEIKQKDSGFLFLKHKKYDIMTKIALLRLKIKGGNAYETI